MKKSIFKLLALLAIFSFVAISCGDDDDSSSSASSSESSSSESSSSEAEKEDDHSDDDGHDHSDEEASEEEAGPDPADGCGYATEGDVPGIDKENRRLFHRRMESMRSQHG